MTKRILRAVGRRKILQGMGLGAASLAMPWHVRAQSAAPAGLLRVAADSEVPNWNPAMVASNGVFFIAAKLFDPLVTRGDDGGLRPALATDWAFAPDGLSARFSLRPGVRWHDGEAFTAADVAYSALELWCRHQNFGRDVFRTLETVETPDALTAIFRFARPVPPQLLANALPSLSWVAPRHLYHGQDPLKNPANAAPIGTGPFRFVEYRRGEKFVIERFARAWHHPQPQLERIEWQVFADKGAIGAALEAGRLDLACFSPLPLTEADALARRSKIQRISQGYEDLAYTMLLEINQRRPELAQVKVRQAIAHAIDRALILKIALQGIGQIADGPIPARIKELQPDTRPAYPFDPAKAEALLDQAGLPRQANGMRFAVKLAPAPFFEQTRLTGEVLRQALRRVGIEVSLSIADAPTHIRSVYGEHAFDLAIHATPYRGDPAISATVFYRSGTPAGVPFSNQYGYANPAMDALIDQAASTLDAAERNSLYRRFQILALEDLPIIPLVEFPFYSLVGPRVQNHHLSRSWPISNWAEVSVV